MKMLVVFDSVFGNTEKIAREIGAALSAVGAVEVLRVGEVSLEQLKGLDYLIVGSPTRAFKATAPVRKLLQSIPPHWLDGVKVAAFDTRADVQEVNSSVLTFMVKLFGYAAGPIAAGLVKKGGLAAGAPAGFYITATEGPLREGELERAAAWASGILGSPSP
jgi:flavodoxin